MKKYFVLGAALALLAASCEMQVVTDDAPACGNVPFELSAEVSPLTHTSIDNSWNVSWEDGDVIYAVTSDGTWGKPYENDNAGNTIADFTYSGGAFSTKSTIADGKYNFRFAYVPGNRSYHRAASTTFSLKGEQECDLNSPLAAIKYNDALFGVASDVTTPAGVLKASMNHVFTLMKVELCNKSGEDRTVKSFSISADKELAGIFDIAFAAPCTASYSKNGMKTITVNVANGLIPSGESATIYFVMAPLTNYSGKVTFRADCAGDEVYFEKTNMVNAISFAAGALNSARFDMSVVKIVPKNQYFDLTIDDTDDATTTLMTWNRQYVSMKVEKNTASTPTNNYYPGTSGKTYTSTRFYTGSKLTLTASAGYQIDSIEFAATSESYANALKGSTWTNAVASIGSTSMLVLVKPVSPSNPVSAKITGTCGFNYVRAYYSALKVVPVTGVGLDATSKTITAGESFTLIPSVIPADASNVAVSWSSSDTGVATVKDGVVTAVAAGTATITVTTAEGEFTATCAVTVNPAPVETGSKTVDIMKEAKLTTSVTLNNDKKNYQIGDITLNGFKGTSNFPAINYNSSKGTDLRFYKGTTCAVKFETPASKPITRIEFLKDQNTASSLGTAFSVDTGTLSGNVWTGETCSVTLTYSGTDTYKEQMYIINVTYKLPE